MISQSSHRQDVSDKKKSMSKRGSGRSHRRLTRKEVSRSENHKKSLGSSCDAYINEKYQRSTDAISKDASVCVPIDDLLFDERIVDTKKEILSEESPMVKWVKPLNKKSHIVLRGPHGVYKLQEPFCVEDADGQQSRFIDADNLDRLYRWYGVTVVSHNNVEYVCNVDGYYFATIKRVKNEGVPGVLVESCIEEYPLNKIYVTDILTEYFLVDLLAFMIRHSKELGLVRIEHARK